MIQNKQLIFSHLADGNAKHVKSKIKENAISINSQRIFKIELNNNIQGFPQYYKQPIKAKRYPFHKKYFKNHIINMID